MAGELTLQDMVDDGALLSLERQIRLEDVLGTGWHFHVDLTASRLEFTGPHPMVVHAQLLGSAAPGPGSWPWSWANTTLPEATTDLARWLRTFGTERDIPELTTAEFPFDSDDVWRRFAIAATAAAPTMRVYLPAPVGSGTTAVLMFDHPDLALPAPDPARILRIMTQYAGESAHLVGDQRRAVRSWARSHGWQIEPTSEGLFLRAPQVSATIRLDELGRIVGVSADAHR